MCTIPKFIMYTIQFSKNINTITSSISCGKIDKVHSTNNYDEVKTY